MGASLSAIAHVINCLFECADMREFMRRRETAVEEYCRMRAAGEACLGLCNEGDRTFPVYAPLLSTSWDAMMGGDFGIVPAFFGQTTETDGVAQNSYSFSVYLNLPSAAWLWAQCWKHHNPGLEVAWDGGVGNDFLCALGGSANIQTVSHPGYRTVIPAGRFRVNHEVISNLIDGNRAEWWVGNRRQPPPPPARVMDIDSLPTWPVPQPSTAKAAGASTQDRVVTTTTVGAPPWKAPPPSAPPIKAPPPHAQMKRGNHFPPLPAARPEVGRPPVKSPPPDSVPHRAAPRPRPPAVASRPT